MAFTIICFLKITLPLIYTYPFHLSPSFLGATSLLCVARVQQQPHIVVGAHVPNGRRRAPRQSPRVADDAHGRSRGVIRGAAGGGE